MFVMEITSLQRVQTAEYFFTVWWEKCYIYILNNVFYGLIVLAYKGHIAMESNFSQLPKRHI